MVWGLTDGWPTKVNLSKGIHWETALLCGVVPERVAALERSLKRAHPSRSCLRFRHDLSCALEVIPRPKASVGDDRLAAALGAWSLDPGRPWIVIDSGTALTVNAVRPVKAGRARFEGGLIMPGEFLTLRALGSGTAQLPELDAWPVVPVQAMGKSTEEAIRSGVRRMQVAAAYDAATAQARMLGKRTRIAFTGGGAEALWSELASRLARFRPVFEPNLVHRGLWQAWRMDRMK